MHGKQSPNPDLSRFDLESGSVCSDAKTRREMDDRPKLLLGRVVGAQRLAKMATLVLEWFLKAHWFAEPCAVRISYLIG